MRRTYDGEWNVMNVETEADDTQRDVERRYSRNRTKFSERKSRRNIMMGDVVCRKKQHDFYGRRGSEKYKKSLGLSGTISPGLFKQPKPFPLSRNS